MSIATKKGDGGKTNLAGGIPTSKSALRVEAYGTVDELNSALGLARSLCPCEEIRDAAKSIQRELFALGSALATPPESPKKQPEISAGMVEALTSQVHRVEALEGVLSDWSIPGETPPSAAFDLARTVCRRAERCTVRLAECGEAVNPRILAYLNRLSDLLWLFGRWIEKQQGADARLRGDGHKGPRWSRAW